MHTRTYTRALSQMLKCHKYMRTPTHTHQDETIAAMSNLEPIKLDVGKLVAKAVENAGPDEEAVRYM